MKKLIALIAAALFATTTLAPVALAADGGKKPTAEECKKNPKLEGCATTK